MTEHLTPGGALPPRDLSSEENRRIERAIGLAMTPDERLAWLEAAVSDLTALWGLAAPESTRAAIAHLRRRGGSP
jgi:hypothetical protein